jgi:PAS domain S-box-containing protein
MAGRKPRSQTATAGKNRKEAAVTTVRSRTAKAAPPTRRAPVARTNFRKPAAAKTGPAEPALSRDRYSDLYEFAPIGYVVLDLRGRIREGNLTAAQMLGVERKRLTGRRLSQFVEPISQDAWHQHWQATLRADAKQGCDLEMRDAKGARWFVHLESIASWDGSDHPERVLTALLDRTPAARAEEQLHLLITALESRIDERTSELRREHEFLNNLIETAQVIILLLDPRGRVALANPYMAALTGYGREEMRGKDWFDTFLPARDRVRIRQLFNRALGGERTRGNINPIVRKDGAERLIEWYDSVLTDERGATTGLLCVGHDVTERERAAEELRHNREQLRALTVRLTEAQEQEGRRLARELHDAFGQRLAALGMSATQLENELGSVSKPLTEKLLELRSGINELAKQIHETSRRLHPSILADLGLEAALKAECERFAELKSIPVDFSAQLAQDPLPDSAALCLYRILQEALTNIGRHALARAVEVRLTSDAKTVTLRVEDIGNGFDLKQRSKGLGLVSMEERAAAEGGRFRVHSEPDVGTTVEVTLPLKR